MTLRLALRRLLRQPLSSALIVLTLAVGIGAAGTVFVVVKAVLLDPLPYPGSDRLVTVVETDSKTADPETDSYATVDDWTQRTNVFTHVAVYADGAIRPVRSGVAVMLRGMDVSVNYFDALGIRAARGRTFVPADAMPGNVNVVVLTDDAWRSTFGSDPSIIGRSVDTTTGTVTIVGVLPRGFVPLHMTNPAERPAMFMPYPAGASQHSGRAVSSRGVRVVARLADGVDVRRAQAAVNAVMQTLIRDHPEYPRDTHVIVTPLRNSIVSGIEQPLWLLQVAVAALFLLACANAGTMLLARSRDRQREMAIRAAIGATRRRLLRDTLTEAVLLASGASVAGTALAWASVGVVRRIADANLPRVDELTPDGSLLLFGAVGAGLTAILCSTIPAAVVARKRRDDVVRVGDGVAGTRDGRRTLERLVIVELGLAFAVVLVVGLLARSYIRLTTVDPGFDPRNLETVSLLPAGGRFQSDADRIRYFDAVAARVQQIAGVQGVAYANTLPLARFSVGSAYLLEHDRHGADDPPQVDTYFVSTNYLAVMSIAVTRGRGFVTADDAGATPVAVVSESGARQLFPGENPIGQHLQLLRRDPYKRWATIVGVVRDVHQQALDHQPQPAVYMLRAQATPREGWVSLIVRSNAPVSALEAAIRSAMLSVDPLQPVFHLQPMSVYVALSVSRQRFALMLVTALGLLALGLGGLGVYGVMSYLVRSRTRELGVRLAVGASPADVRSLVGAQVARCVGAGLVCGVTLAAIEGRSLSALVFGIDVFDLPTVGIVAAVVIVTAGVAAAAPIRRASRVDPVIVLRAE